jgi:hypothetical protein
MNKLIFTEGGQPVYLEDLELLQESMMDLIRSLFPLTDGDESSDDAAYRDVRKLPVYATSRHIYGSADSNSIVFQAHKLITQDAVYDVAETVINESDTDSGNASERDCYYVLKEEAVEKREFEDGVTRTVWKNYTATITGHKPTSGTYYAVTDVPALDGLLSALKANTYGVLK